MSDMTGDPHDGDAWCAEPEPAAAGPRPAGPTTPAERVTPEGAEWLASASPFPRSVRALWAARPGAPGTLPCGRTFDVISFPALFGRRVVDRLWSIGPGCGPVAVHRERVLVFATPGTADRLPALLAWEEWGGRVPALMCHGHGDSVTVPPPGPPAWQAAAGRGPRWLVAPGERHPWLPGAAVVLWACLRAARPDGGAAG